MLFCEPVRLSCVINAYLITYLLTTEADIIPAELRHYKVQQHSPSNSRTALGKAFHLNL